MTNNTIDAALEIGANDIIRAHLKNKDTKESFKITVKLMRNKDRLQTKTTADRLVKALSGARKKQGNELEVSTAAYMCAVSFAILSHRERKAGEFSRALFALNRSNYYLGVLHSYSSKTFVPSPETEKAIQIIKDIADGGSKGGKNKDKKLEPIINKAAELISTLKPEGGWSSKIEAAQGIVKRLNEFIRNYRPNDPDKPLRKIESEDRRIDLILDWTRERPIVSNAYIANASQKALKRIKNKNLKKHEDAPLSPADEP